MTKVRDFKHIGAIAASKILSGMLDSADRMTEDAHKLVLQARAKEMFSTVDAYTKSLVLQRLQKPYREVLTGEKIESKLLTPFE